MPAFPGAVGQGAAATGGRGGDVYHVTTLSDYDTRKGQSPVPGSLRHAVQSAQGPRTIVFDVGGAIALAGPLQISQDKLTIAGQTSPTGGVTLWGYPVELFRASDVIIRFLRVRTGDFHARGRKGSFGPRGSNGNNDLDAGSANGVDVGSACRRVILDHLSVSWGMDETLSVTNARDITVQHTIISESLNDSYHPKGEHGYGSLVRGDLSPELQAEGVGGYTFYGNLWAHHRARNPSLGGKQRLARGRPESERPRTDVNLVNNVVYDWGDQPTHRSNLGEVRVNVVGNYYVNGPSNSARYVFNENNPATTLVYECGNFHDTDQDQVHDGEPIDTQADMNRSFRGFGEDDVLLSSETGEPFEFFRTVSDHVRPADEAYTEVVRAAGASLVRDAVDKRVVESLVHCAGDLIDSQEELRDEKGNLPGVDDLPTIHRPAAWDTDGDGMPNKFEIKYGLDPNDPEDRNDASLSEQGYTNLEVYLNGLVVD